MDTVARCTYDVNLEPTLEVRSATVLGLASGDYLDVSKTFMIKGVATVLSDTEDLELEITSDAGVLHGLTQFSSSSVKGIMAKFLSGETVYVSPPNLARPTIDKLHFRFKSPLFGVLAKKKLREEMVAGKEKLNPEY
jgi:hypothetical protein